MDKAEKLLRTYTAIDEAGVISADAALKAIREAISERDALIKQLADALEWFGEDATDGFVGDTKWFRTRGAALIAEARALVEGKP